VLSARAFGRPCYEERVEPFDPETLADLKFRAKKQLRKRQRGLRSAHAETVLATASAQICERVLALPAFTDATSVGLFWTLSERREVNVRPLLDAALACGKRVYFPFLAPKADGFETGFREITHESQLADRGQRFFEPPLEAPRATRGEIDLLIVPALAAAADGHRLGYGMGFYDATLPDFCPPARSIVVLYDFGLLGELPATENDVRCDVIVTERRTLEV